MKLHSFVGSPHGRKAEAVIHHLGLKVEIDCHDLFRGELAAAEYAALNPNGMVPLLVDGAFTLWESNAIMQYLADKAGDTALFPREPQLRADIARWQFWELSHFNKAFGQLGFEAVGKPRLNLGPTDEALVARAQADLARLAPVLERHLAGRQYVVGDGLTIADYSMVPFEGYRKLVPFDWTAYPNINAYFDRIRATEAWQHTAVRDPSTIGRRPKAA